MSITPERAAFIKEEYRWSTATNAGTLAVDKSAREVEVPANVDAATAASLAATILSQNTSARLHEFKIEGYLSLDQFLAGVPRYIPDIAEFGTDGRTYRLLSFESDLNFNITKVTVIS